MIIDKYKSGATVIKIDDKYIKNEKEDKEILNILLEIAIKKISEYY